MKFTYRLVQDRTRWYAECVEADAAGEGKTSGDAVASLRAALEERLFRPDAVAPPEQTETPSIDLELAGDRPSADLNGPGDARV